MEHWRKALDPNWIGTYILPDGQPITAQIKSVTFGKGLKVAGKSKDGWVAEFEPNQFFNKPMLLNPTNLKRLTQLTGCPYPEKWGSTLVFLTQEMSKMPDGTQDFALRIGFSKPQPAAKPDYSQQIAMLKECKTIEDLATVYKSLTKGQQTGCFETKEECKTKLTQPAI